MNTVLWIFIAFAFGLLLFTSLQGDLPKELSFLRADPVVSVRQAGGAAAGASAGGTTFDYEGWRVRQSGQAVEFVKTLTGHLELDGNPVDNPELGILCNAGRLDVRIDTRLAVNGTKTTPVQIGPESEAWDKGTGRNIFPHSPANTVRTLAQATSVLPITLSFVDIGRQSVQLDPKGLKGLYDQLPASCR